MHRTRRCSSSALRVARGSGDDNSERLGECASLSISHRVLPPPALCMPPLLQARSPALCRPRATLHVETPLVHSVALSEALGTGAPVFLKLDCCQPCGSFKLRGLGAVCQAAVQQRGAQQLVSSSGGNAGLAVAYAARALGCACTVVLPRSTPEHVRVRLEGYGAQVQVAGAHWLEAHAHAGQLAQSTGGELVHPFEGEEAWLGHASAVTEMQAQLAHVAEAARVSQAIQATHGAPGALVLSVGGGGLLLGALRGLELTGWAGGTSVVAVETQGADCLSQALQAGALVTLPAITSVATSLGAPCVSPTAFEASKDPERRVHSHVVSDQAAVRACVRFLDDHRLLVEPACGASLAAVYDRAPALLHAPSVVVLVCGGACVDVHTMTKLAAQTGVWEFATSAASTLTTSVWL